MEGLGKHVPAETAYKDERCVVYAWRAEELQARQLEQSSQFCTGVRE
jgi:hypothetical protein